MLSFERFKKLAVVFLLLIFASMLLGCGMDKGNVYDSDKEIAKEGDSYTFVGRSGNESKNRIDVSFRKFAGVQTLWLIEAKEDGVIELDYDNEITKGDFKLVVVTPEGEVDNVAEQTNKGSYKVTTSKGKYRIKIVGRTATGEFEMDLETKGVKRVSHPGSV